MDIKVVYQDNIDIPEWMLAELDGNQLLAEILLQRGIDTLEEVQQFLNMDLYPATEAEEIPGVVEAVDLILEMIEANKKIYIYGDYDVDGITATTILVSLLRKLDADVSYHIPNRFTEGYGMNKEVIKRMADEDTDLIITCDCGISNLDEVAQARNLGMKVIVTDHHHLPDELPPADVILTAKLLEEEHRAHYISGASTAYFLIKGILSRLGNEKLATDYLDLVALSTVGDVVPLRKENRYLLKKGIPVLKRSNRPGLVQLLDVCNLKKEELSEEEIAFQIVPRLNAAGRIRSAKLGVELLLADNWVEAKQMAVELDQINKRRKEIGDEMLDEASELLGPDFAGKPVILYQPHWHQGIVGITAGRLSEEYHVPALLMTLKEDEKTITGSARSIPGIHIYDALKKCQQFLDKFGGHAGAAGFSLTRDKLTGFVKSMERVLNRQLTEQGRVKEIRVDSRLSLERINKATYRNLRKLAPFGEANPVPLFVTRDTEVVYHRPTSNDKHLRMIVKEGEVQHPAIWWWGGQVDISHRVDLIYSVGLNRWQGKEEIQLIVDQTVNRDQINESKIKKPAKLAFEIEDYRNWRQIGRVLPEFEGVISHFEGLQKPNLDNLINRYQQAQGDSLILYTCPPGIRALRELVYLNRPERLILAYSNKTTQRPQDFMNNLLGIIKHVLKEKKGRINIYQLSALTGEMENTVLLGLRFFEDKGFITINFDGPDKLFISRGTGENIQGAKLKEKRLRELLKESRAFRKYMLKSSPDNIKRLITK